MDNGTILLSEYKYDFVCTCENDHLYFIMSPGKIIFAVLEL